MKRAFETAECEAIRRSIFWELRYEKHENQIKGCAWKLRYEKHENQIKGFAVELKVSDWQMSAWTSCACDTVKGQRGMVDDRCVTL